MSLRDFRTIDVELIVHVKNESKHAKGVLLNVLFSMYETN